ncbi:MAG: transcriptional repressor LexA [Spirochaetales bacterium]
MKKSEENLLKLYKFIKSFTASNGYPPTVREMATYLDVKSTSTIAYYLDKLEKDNKIKKSPSKNRALELLGDAKKEKSVIKTSVPVDFLTTPIPMLGNITAGQPILAVEEHDEVYNMPKELFGGDGLFMLKVKGESMINAGIYDGDKIIVQQQSNAKNGDIVVALIEDEATVKTFYKESNRYRLQPENDTMQPIYVNEVSILGKVVGLIRKL